MIPALPRLSLTARLTALFAVVSSTVLVALGLFIVDAIEHHFSAQDREALDGKIELVGKLVTRVDSPAALAALRGQLQDAFVGHRDMVVLALAPDGSPLLATPAVGFPAIRLRREAVAGNIAAFDWEAGGNAYRGFATALPTRLPGSAPVQVAVALDVRHHQRFMDRFDRSLSIFIVLAALVSGVFGWIVARRGLAPLRTMSERAASVTATRLDQRLPEDAVPPELADLAHTLNRMLERLEDAFRRLSEFSSDLAHELRTPISNLMTQTQVALAHRRSAGEYRDALASNAEEFERLARMISDMLFLAKADHGLMLPSVEDIVVEDQVRELLEFYDALAEARQVRLTQHGSGRFRGDRLMLRRALGNLLSNALRHTPAGGEVGIAINTAADGVRVVVANSGTEIPATDLPHLFDRFYRGDKSRGHAGAEGSGLGLAITRAIVVAHGGDIAVASDARSTRFEMRFPPAAPAPARAG